MFVFQLIAASVFTVLFYLLTKETETTELAIFINWEAGYTFGIELIAISVRCYY
jgi:hypothetical protein